MLVHVLSQEQVSEEYPNFKVVKYNRDLNNYEEIKEIPLLGMYHVSEGINELELL